MHHFHNVQTPTDTIYMRYDYFQCNPNSQHSSQLWDTDWNADYLDSGCISGDWILFEEDSSLESNNQLRTAVLLCLFTDKRAYDDDITPNNNEDRRGWWGDGIDINPESGEQELGSRLWLLERSTLNQQTKLFAEEEAKQALQTLITQGAVAKIDVESDISYQTNSLTLTINLYSSNGTNIYKQKFQRYWDRI